MLRFVLPIRLSLSVHSEMKTFIFIVTYRRIHRPGMYKVHKDISITFYCDFRLRFCRHSIKCVFHSEYCRRWFSREWLTSVVILEPTSLLPYLLANILLLHTVTHTIPWDDFKRSQSNESFLTKYCFEIIIWILNYLLGVNLVLLVDGIFVLPCTQPMIICTCKMGKFSYKHIGENCGERTGWNHLSYSEIIGPNAFCHFPQKIPSNSKCSSWKCQLGCVRAFEKDGARGTAGSQNES